MILNNRFSFYLIYYFIVSSYVFANESTDLNIQIEAVDYSAKIYLASEEREVTKEEKTIDKQRRKFAPGESFFLTVTSNKYQLRQDGAQINWDIISKEQSVNVILHENNTELFVRLNNIITKNEIITFRATNELGIETSITIEVVLPTGIRALHARKSSLP